MTCMNGGVLVGACAASVAALGGVAYWMKERRVGLNDQVEKKVGDAYKKRVDMMRI